ncbi:MAG: hypothetical protein NVV70_05165 [Cellulomonas sp.]|uniref:AbiEi antitoxin C-terminal domain-containing protein n=1 Tax=Cellulomonas gelida TaxID=1712 RepID=A0A4Y3KIL8_9CELL|nr:MULTISPECIES: hypothetical protein [Cellulomonas]KMM45319.1 hypothetical protein CWIS_11230 [Cellulomonas sp. A375-1]MCR6647546.1 hypothetical protein [Cellulomonas sp.]GEA84259.1 hypothetical protein CGE01nite_15100 [Cellulomonas gelida]GGL36649.1 hypothetical protein GCM10009774_29030 [Cellulomonas gelida]
MTDALSLLPTELVLPRLVRRCDTATADWAGMLRDGVLLPVTESVAVVGPEPPSPDDRARALVTALPRHGVLGRDSAAWVHTGTRPPARACVLVPVGVRRPAPRPDRTCAEAVFGPSDVVLVAGTAVTTPERTAEDVARWLAPDDAVARLVDLAAHGLDLATVRRRLTALAGRRHVRRAHAVLEAALERDGAQGDLARLSAARPPDANP